LLEIPVFCVVSVIVLTLLAVVLLLLVVVIVVFVFLVFGWPRSAGDTGIWIVLLSPFNASPSLF